VPCIIEHTPTGKHGNERTRMDEPILLSIEKAAEALSIGRSKTYELISEGRLLTVNIGRRRLVRTDSIRAIANGEAA
jgi:excisionase family DNA binding protein